MAEAKGPDRWVDADGIVRLRNEAIIAGGNPCHQPAGSPIGGQFAPKGSCSTGGTGPGGSYQARLGFLGRLIRTKNQEAYRDRVEEIKEQLRAESAPSVLSPPRAGSIPGLNTTRWKQGQVGVYIIQSGDSNRFKIGKTVDLDQRLDTLQTGSPEKLTVVGFLPVNLDGKSEDDVKAEITRMENNLHKKYAGSRVKTSGSAKEWFEIDEFEARMIAS